MGIDYVVDNNICKIFLSGELDENTSIYFKTAIDKIVGNLKSFMSVEYDLTGLSFMDSTGIGVLIGRYKKYDNKNIEFTISNPNKTIDRILKMTGIYSIMPRVAGKGVS